MLVHHDVLQFMATSGEFMMKSGAAAHPQCSEKQKGFNIQQKQLQAAVYVVFMEKCNSRMHCNKAMDGSN